MRATQCTESAQAQYRYEYCDSVALRGPHSCSVLKLHGPAVTAAATEGGSEVRHTLQVRGCELARRCALVAANRPR